MPAINNMDELHRRTEDELERADKTMKLLEEALTQVMNESASD